MAIVGKKIAKRYTTLNKWLYEARPAFIAAAAIWLLKFSEVGTAPLGKTSGVVLLAAAVYTFYLRHNHRTQAKQAAPKH